MLEEIPQSQNKMMPQHLGRHQIISPKKNCAKSSAIYIYPFPPLPPPPSPTRPLPSAAPAISPTLAITVGKQPSATSCILHHDLHRRRSGGRLRNTAGVGVVAGAPLSTAGVGVGSGTPPEWRSSPENRRGRDCRLSGSASLSTRIHRDGGNKRSR